MMDINNKTYDELKLYYDNILNKDQSTFKTSNDEPTPIDCIETMLSKLPMSILHKKGLKVLDPCCGNGNFHLVMHNILRNHGYESSHIINKVLYFNDTNQRRIDNVVNIFGQGNVSTIDFLQYDENAKFDIIIANPPYAKIMDNGKRASKNHNLVQSFISKSLRLLNDGGFLVYIVPDNWMSLSDRNVLLKVMSYYQFHWLDIHGAKKWFKHIGSSFTWFVLEKTPAYKPFTVDCVYKKTTYSSVVNSQVRNYIPLLYTNIVQSILQKTIDADNVKFPVETSSNLHKYTKQELISTQKDSTFQYRLIHTPKQTVYASRPHKFQEGFKVFISTTDTFKVFVDNCGMTQSIAFIRCATEQEAQHIVTILKHTLYKFLNDICRWGNFNNIRILQKFPVATNPENVYKQFNLTDEEICFIENAV